MNNTAAASGSIQLQTENVEYWMGKWKQGDTRWQKNYIDPVLEVYLIFMADSK